MAIEWKRGHRHSMAFVAGFDIRVFDDGRWSVENDNNTKASGREVTRRDARARAEVVFLALHHVSLSARMQDASIKARREWLPSDLGLTATQFDAVQQAIRDAIMRVAGPREYSPEFEADWEACRQ